MSESSNKAKGVAFEEFAKRKLEARLGQTLEHPEPINGHKFDLASPDRSIIINVNAWNGPFREMFHLQK